MALQATIYEGTSKKTGKEFKALRIKIGLFEKLLFLQPVEIDYVERQLRADAHDDFAESEEVE